MSKRGINTGTYSLYFESNNFSVMNKLRLLGWKKQRTESPSRIGERFCTTRLSQPEMPTAKWLQQMLKYNFGHTEDRWILLSSTIFQLHVSFGETAELYI